MLTTQNERIFFKSRAETTRVLPNIDDYVHREKNRSMLQSSYFGYRPLEPKQNAMTASNMIGKRFATISNRHPLIYDMSMEEPSMPSESITQESSISGYRARNLMDEPR